MLCNQAINCFHETLCEYLQAYSILLFTLKCTYRCYNCNFFLDRFWLFEPRCGMHDIGGWYVETFGRDKKGRNVPSQRYWDGLDANDHFDK